MSTTKAIKSKATRVNNTRDALGHTDSCKHILLPLHLHHAHDISTPPPGHPSIAFIQDEEKTKDCLTGRPLIFTSFELDGEEIGPGKVIKSLTLPQLYEHTNGGIPTYLVVFIEAVW